MEATQPRNSPPPPPDSLRPSKLLNRYVAGDARARAAVDCWAGPVRTRQKPGHDWRQDRRGARIVAPTDRTFLPSDGPREPAPPPGANATDLWAAWHLSGSREDAGKLIQKLRPWLWKRCAKLWMSSDSPIVAIGTGNSKVLDEVNDLVDECLLEILAARSRAQYINRFLNTLVDRVYGRLVLRQEYDAPAKKDRKTGELVSRGNPVFHVPYNSGDEDDSDDKYAALQRNIAAEIERVRSEERGLRDLPTQNLKGRLRDVVQLLQLGLSKRQIASRLRVSQRTIERLIAEHCKPARAIPAMSAAAARLGVRLRVIVRLTPAQQVFLHNVQSGAAA